MLFLELLENYLCMVANNTSSKELMSHPWYHKFSLIEIWKSYLANNQPSFPIAILMLFTPNIVSSEWQLLSIFGILISTNPLIYKQLVHGIRDHYYRPQQ